ncbi:MAG: hypothetical protein JSU77_11325 [Fidelibacterota bacterium]|nr:MAG: hypothetical protein JSU77_11325 [Candidatus Neomarinimicrobiota bacterium]
MRLFLIILFAGTVLFGSGPATGGYAGAFTRIGGDARSVALAGALVADVNSGYLALTNPASLVYVQRREIGLSYMSLPLDRSLQTLSLALGLPPSAAASLSYLRAGDDNIQGRNSIGEPTEALSYNENMVVLSFANRLNPVISLGINAKLLFVNLGDEASEGFGLDLGLLYHRPSGFNLALKVQNITGAYSWKVAASMGKRNYVDYLPVTVSLGGRLPWRHFTFLGQTDVVVPKIKDGDKVTYGSAVPVSRLAVEDLLGERYFIRGGFENTTPTLGVGLRYSIRQSYDSRVDYSLSLGKSGEGIGHFFTWTFSI